MDITTYALLNKKIKGLTSGVKSAAVQGTSIVFTFNDDTTQTITFSQPKDGVSVTSIDIDTNNHLICALSDGSTVDAGLVKTVQGERGATGKDGKDGANGTNGSDGADGISPTITITEATGRHTVSITDKDGVHSFVVKDGSALDADNYYTKDEVIAELTKKANTDDIPGVIDDDITGEESTWSSKKINEIIPTTLPANGGNAETVNGHTVESDVPADAKFTDTTYSNATSSADGLMSATDKVKLDSGIATKLNASSYREIIISTSDWEGYANISDSTSSGGFKCTKTLDMAMPFENFSFEVKLSTDDAAAKLQIQNWNYIMADGRIAQTTDESGNTTEFTFYAFTTQPTVELVISIQGVSGE